MGMEARAGSWEVGVSRPFSSSIHLLTSPGRNTLLARSRLGAGRQSRGGPPRGPGWLGGAGRRRTSRFFFVTGQPMEKMNMNACLISTPKPSRQAHTPHTRAHAHTHTLSSDAHSDSDEKFKRGKRKGDKNRTLPILPPPPPPPPPNQKKKLRPGSCTRSGRPRPGPGTPGRSATPGASSGRRGARGTPAERPARRPAGGGRASAGLS